MITKFKLLRQKKRFQKYLGSYHFLIIFTAFGLLAFSNINPAETGFEGRLDGSRLPASTVRLPKDFQKPKQMIMVDTDFEILSQDNQIRLTGKIEAPSLSDQEVHYKWNLVENAVLLGGADQMQGDMDMSAPQDIAIDVIVKDPKKPLRMQLEAFTFLNDIKYSNLKHIVINPEDFSQSKFADRANVKAQQNMDSQNLSKGEMIKQQLENNQKSPARQ